MDVFSKDYIFIPIGYKGHWYLVLLAFLTKMLLDDEGIYISIGSYLLHIIGVMMVY